MPAPATPKPDGDLRESSMTVLYEIQMLFGVAKELETRAVSEPEPLPWAREMALIEAFGLHARALIEFLWRSRAEERGPRKTDVLAEDFFDPGEWARHRLPQEATITDVSRRVGREVVHLTYHRQQLTADARAWPFAQIAGSIGRPLRVFIQNVPRARIDDDFKNLAWAAMPAYLQGPSAISFPPTFWPPSTATRMADTS